MDTFYVYAIRTLPWLRTHLVYGFSLLVVLAFIYVKTESSTPIIAQIFIFSVIPLLVAMVLIEEHLGDIYKFILILTITIMCLAFLGAGIVLAQLRHSDKTSAYEQDHKSQIEPIERVLNKRYLEENKSEILKSNSYSEYRNIVLKIAKTDNSSELRSGIDKIISFYQDYLSCRELQSCIKSSQFDGRIRDIWYTYRPIIEDRRVELYDSDYAGELQRHAEKIKPPRFSSKVHFDSATNSIIISNTYPNISWTEIVIMWLKFAFTKLVILFET